MDMPRPEGPLKKPPRGFDPRSATPEELEKFQYPPRPDPKTSPKQHAEWLRIASRCPLFVRTKYSERTITNLDESRNWSGAVLPSGGPYDSIIGSWIIPNSHPLVDNSDDDSSDDDTDTDDDDYKYVDGDYQCYTWVGLDGWTNQDCCRVGVVLYMTVEGGKVTSRSAKAAIQFRGVAEKKGKIHVFNDFDVSPGDLVTAWVWAPVNGNTGNGWICNEAANSWASASIKAPKGVVMHGASAEWVLAGKNPSDTAPLFPNYGATVFFNGLAHCEAGDMVSINEAMIISAQDVTSAGVRDTDGVIVHSVALF